MSAESIVRDFCAAVAKLDIPALGEFFADDALYHNIPIDPVRGRAEIVETLRQFIDPDGEAEFEIVTLAVDGNRVFTERIDRLVVQGKRVELPVAGVFEIDGDGKISVWRDYFDLASLIKQIG